MEINRLTPLDGKTADNLDQLQAASNAYPTDNGGGFLENWDLDPNRLSSFQDTNNGIIGQWTWRSLEDPQARAQLMTEQAAQPHEAIHHSDQAMDDSNTSDRGQVSDAAGAIADPAWEHFPTSSSDQDLSELDANVPASDMHELTNGHPGLSSSEVALIPPASNVTVQGDCSSSLQGCQIFVIHDELPEQSLQKDVSDHKVNDTKDHDDGSSFIGSVSGLLGSISVSKAPSSGISRLHVPLSWTPPKFAKLPPKPSKRKLPTYKGSTLESSESGQTSKRARTTDQRASTRVSTDTIQSLDQSHGPQKTVMLVSRNAGGTSKQNNGASRPCPAPIIKTPTHTASSATEVNKIACQLPTPKSAASGKGPYAASQHPEFASPSTSKGNRNQGSFRDRTRKGADGTGHTPTKSGQYTPAKSGSEQHASTGLTIHDVIVLSDDEEPTDKVRQQAYLPKRHTDLSESVASRQNSVTSKQPSQVAKDNRYCSQTDRTSSGSGAACIPNVAVFNRGSMSKSGRLAENASMANSTTAQTPWANAAGRQQNTASQQLIQSRLAARHFQQSLPAITTRIGAKGTSKPLDLTGFQGSRPITRPAAPATQAFARPMGKGAALMILQKTAAPAQNRFTTHPSQHSRQMKRPASDRSEQSWHDIRDKQATRDDIKSQKRQEKFRLDIKSAHPDLPEEEVQRRVDTLEKTKQLELFKRKEERAAKKAYRSRPGELEHDNSTELTNELEAIRKQTRLTRPLSGLDPARLVIAYKVIKTYPYVDSEEAEERYVEEKNFFLEKERANDHAQAVFLNESDPVLQQAGEGTHLKEMTMIFNDDRDGLFEGHRVFSNGKKHSVIVDFFEMQAGDIQPSMHRGRKLSRQAKAAYSPVQFVVWAFFTIDKNARKCATRNTPRSSRSLSKEEMSLLVANQITVSERKVLSAVVSPLPKSLYGNYEADMEDQAAEDDQDLEANPSLNPITTAEQGNEHVIDDSDSGSDDGAHNRTLDISTMTTRESVTITSDTPPEKSGDNPGLHFEEKELEAEEDESLDDEEESEEGDSFDQSTANLTYHPEQIASFTTLRAANIEAYRVYLKLFNIISLNSCIHPTCTCRQAGLSDFLRDNQTNPMAEAAAKGIDLSKQNDGYDFDNDPAYRLPLNFRHLRIFVKKKELIGPLPVGEGLIDNTEELEEEVTEKRDERKEMLRREEARKEAKKVQELERQVSRIRQQEKALDQELTESEMNRQQAQQQDINAGDVATEDEQQRLLDQELQEMDDEDSDVSEEE
ncbi:hypothetical protein MCOR27_011122 [Pyricularia oryzae]|uniref:Uncharacterized protein n=2 Tax=Pyricularia TaxID=48558 RepID=A0ABQ8NMU8_PYRGI|nr:hypothetical protein MCOR01_001275 [Pyricularia oryzae]KAI6299446.1 hypothetical protein MCOR33_004581 [Pyricularia grisea]KAH9430182.1 hypothetical protein MCOR02_009904 [Pyricularia oryzae]KAI6263317.1 hypothetical protein MCOR19_000442 [Pyricularia oryzae]KAI6263930.1 hypothetical protein MCOR26_011726 [Pyricularia oryzae]